MVWLPCDHLSPREVWVTSWWRAVGVLRTLLLNSSRGKRTLAQRWGAACSLEVRTIWFRIQWSLLIEICYAHICISQKKSWIPAPVPQFCFFMVSWTYSLGHDSVQLSCEIPTVTQSWDSAVWCVTSRLMCGVWECCCSPSSVDTCPLMMTTAWFSTGRLR